MTPSPGLQAKSALFSIVGSYDLNKAGICGFQPRSVRKNIGENRY